MYVIVVGDHAINFFLLLVRTNTNIDQVHVSRIAISSLFACARSVGVSE
jgi:hypothetical protein